MTADGALGKSVTLLTRVNCAQMFFIYPGRADVFRDRGMTFLSLIQSAGLGDRNLALIADPYGENYARGLSAEIPDLQSLLDWHKSRLRALPHVTDVYLLGNSSGGYGAMLFGHLLGARKVWAVTPRTARLATADAAKAFLRELLMSRGRGATEYFIYYSPSNRRDCAFAEYFAACPGVVLSPYIVPSMDTVEDIDMAGVEVDDWTHWGVMRTLRTSGDLRRLIPPLVRTAGRDGAAAT